MYKSQSHLALPNFPTSSLYCVIYTPVYHSSDSGTLDFFEFLWWVKLFFTMGPLRVKVSLSGTLFSQIIVYQSVEKAFIQICMKTHSFSSQKSVGISWFWPHHLFYLLQTEKYIYLYILFHFNLKIVQGSNWLLSSMRLLQSQPSCLKSSLSLSPRVVISYHRHQQQYVLIHNLAWSSQI